jgi:cytidine deaminase
MPANLYKPVNALSAQDIALLQMAKNVAAQAFNPVSKFQVGAAVLDLAGQVFHGTLFESSALPLGICAEPAALSAALSAGSRDFAAIAVVGGDPAVTELSVPITPCGGCRHRLYDITGGARNNIRVLCSELTLTHVLEVRIVDLLPHAFDASVLPSAAWSSESARSERNS